LAEAPSFKIGTINVGDRQKGRLKADSVIDCKPEKESIKGALERLRSPSFQENLQHTRNPYGDGGASQMIVKTLCSYPLEGLLKKHFFDIRSPEVL
jgi:GDP/UDP-N,N'-diacetylbacillosamine 2-epimerase (hydrolysing)